MSKESDEKRELLRLKQGLIEDSDIIEQDVHEEPEELTAVKKIDNFFYRNKWFVVAGVFFAAVAVFLVHQMLSREQPDLTVILAVYSIDLTKSGNMQYIQSNTAKFYGEIERGVAELYICDADLLTSERASEEYDPDDESMTLTYENMFSDIGEALGIPEYNGKLRIDLNDTGFVYAAKWENSCPDTLAFSIRREIPGMVSYSKSGEYQKRAKEVLTNILTGNKVNEAAENNSSEQGE